MKILYLLSFGGSRTVEPGTHDQSRNALNRKQKCGLDRYIMTAGLYLLIKLFNLKLSVGLQSSFIIAKT